MEQAAAEATAPFGRGGENPYQVQQDLQDLMQDLVGICRREDEMRRALDGLEKLKERARRVGVVGNREYNGGWHTALDLHHLLSVSEMITRAALERKESRGAHFRDDYPEKSDAEGKCNIVVKRGAGGDIEVMRQLLNALPAELQQVITEMK